MSKQDYTTSFTVDQSAAEVFTAVNNVRGWWSGEIDGRTDKLGADFTYRYQNLHRTTQKITEFVPGKKVVWHVVNSKINFVKDKDEWNGTDIVFEIAKKGDKTELRFTHVGLIPAIECYGKCTGAWGYYINESLRSLITIIRNHGTAHGRSRGQTAGYPLRGHAASGAARGNGPNVPADERVPFRALAKAHLPFAKRRPRGRCYA